MTEFKNTTGERRVWPTIQRPDGTTLELDVDETADLDVPEDFKAAGLTSTAPEKKLTKKEKDKAKVDADSAAAADAEPDANANADKETQS